MQVFRASLQMACGTSFAVSTETFASQTRACVSGVRTQEEKYKLCAG